MPADIIFKSGSHDSVNKLMTVRIRELLTKLILINALLIPFSKDVACKSFFDNETAKQTFVESEAPKISSASNFEATDFKSKSNARMYSAVFTSVPIGMSRIASNGWKLSDQSITSMFLLVSGSIMGPSAGSIYADDWSIIRNGVITRSLSLALVITGSILNEQHNNADNLLILGRVLRFTGLGIFAGSAFYDTIFVSAHSVEYQNARIRMEMGASSINTVKFGITAYPDIRVHLFF